MSRAEDISFVESQIRTLGLQRTKVAEENEAFRKQITAQILKVLQDAGVLEAVQELETAREQRRAEDQKKVDMFTTNITELQGVLAFLKAREADEPAPPNPAPEAPPKSRAKK